MDSTQITPTNFSDEEANLLALQFTFSSAVPMVITTAIQLDLLEIMAKAGAGALLCWKILIIFEIHSIPTKNLMNLSDRPYVPSFG
ncbi:hypothetical protein GQ457_16G027360 [Hibiscus cannabinus]